MIPQRSAISFWTLVKTLPAVGAPEGCQAGWDTCSVPSSPSRAYLEKTGAPAQLHVWWGAEGDVWCPAHVDCPVQLPTG